MNIARLFQRQRPRKNGAQLKNQLLSLTEADLADMGIKRYQLETKLLG
jgi:uncharacterized protein YjiS (DUF1127 family)